jgi:hypothetical protein
MVTRPTTLILGAGSSQHYGFPSARDLKADICEQFSNENSPAVKLLCETPGSDFDHYDFVSFAKALRLSGQPSADAFLERNAPFIDIGKTAIAYCLIAYENEEKLFPARSAHHLYEYIFSKLESDIRDFGANKLSIITFNYDRSLEHFLETALCNSNQTTASTEQVKEAMSSLPILHVYGQLAILPWQIQNPSCDLVRAYRPTQSYPDVLRAARTIKIVSEKKEDNLDKDPDFLRAWQLIDNAERLCFLGFGYHETNLDRLKIDNARDRWKIYGTAMGLPRSDCQRVKNKLRSIELTDFDCLQMLQHFGILS